MGHGGGGVGVGAPRRAGGGQGGGKWCIVMQNGAWRGVDGCWAVAKSGGCARDEHGGRGRLSEHGGPPFSNGLWMAWAMTLIAGAVRWLWSIIRMRQGNVPL